MSNTHNALIRTNNNGVGEEVANNLSGGSGAENITSEFTPTSSITEFQVYRVGKMIILSAFISSTTTGNITICNIPDKYKPLHRITSPILNGSTNALAGMVWVAAGATSLDGNAGDTSGHKATEVIWCIA